MIKAECHTDDHVFKVEFDALPWLKQASDDQIIELDGCDYAGDSPADNVALFCQDFDPELKNLFAYLEKVNEVRRKCCGFEVWVDAEAIRKWVSWNRSSDLARRIKE